MKAILGGKIYYDNQFIENSFVVFDDKVRQIGSFNNLSAVTDIFPHEGVSEVIELPDDFYLVPGFINVHVHGGAGSDSMDGTLEALDRISRSLAKSGVTSFLPTTMTMGQETIDKALSTIREVQSSVGDTAEEAAKVKGARILGAHLEGPFVSGKYKGCQDAEHIQIPNPQFVEKYLDVITVMTIAPEVEGAMNLIEVYSNKIRFSLGHSAASFNQASKAFSLGATGVSHLFNAMSPLHHREPGLVGAALSSKDVFVEMICDDIHIHPSVYQLVLDLKGPDKVLLITDAMRAAGMPNGSYEFGGHKVRVEEGRCLLEDGTIAGSVLTFNLALKNFVKSTNCKLEDAIKMTSQNQAKYLGLDDRLGRIEEGYFADFTILDKNFDIYQTIINGKYLFVPGMTV